MNIEQLRNDTPACKDKLFLNSAGASLMPSVVVDKIQEFLAEEVQIGGYKTAENRRAEIEEFYVEVGRLLNTEPSNISFANSASDAFGKALSSIPFKEGDVLITSDNDYVSNFLQFYIYQHRFGVQIKRIRSLENGDLDITHLEELIKERQPKLIAVTHIPTNSGLVQDVEAVGQLCAQYDILFLLDACQSFGQLPLDVKALGCDFLSATGRKFMRGPRGTGILYVSDKVVEKNLAPLTMDLAGATWTSATTYELVDSAKRFSLFEVFYGTFLGLKEAVRYANQIGMENIQQYNQQLRARLTANFNAIDKVRILDHGPNLCNIFTFRKEGISYDRMKEQLDAHKVFYSVSERGSALIDFDKKGVDWAARFSPHYFNTLEEMDRVSEIVKGI